MTVYSRNHLTFFKILSATFLIAPQPCPRPKSTTFPEDAHHMQTRVLREYERTEKWKKNTEVDKMRKLSLAMVSIPSAHPSRYSKHTV